MEYGDEFPEERVCDDCAERDEEEATSTKLSGHCKDDGRIVWKAGKDDYRVRAKDPAGRWREVGGFATREAAERYANAK